MSAQVFSRYFKNAPSRTIHLEPCRYITEAAVEVMRNCGPYTVAWHVADDPRFRLCLHCWPDKAHVRVAEVRAANREANR